MILHFGTSLAHECLMRMSNHAYRHKREMRDGRRERVTTEGQEERQRRISLGEKVRRGNVRVCLGWSGGQ